MTHEKAVKILKGLQKQTENMNKVLNCGFEEELEALEFGIEALRKDIQQAPEYPDFSKSDEAYFKCPNCGADLNQARCPECGQDIDWNKVL